MLSNVSVEFRSVKRSRLLSSSQTWLLVFKPGPGSPELSFPQPARLLLIILHMITCSNFLLISGLLLMNGLVSRLPCVILAREQVLRCLSVERSSARPGLVTGVLGVSISVTRSGRKLMIR